jgi:hypothetical protein
VSVASLLAGALSESMLTSPLVKRATSWRPRLRIRPVLPVSARPAVSRQARRHTYPSCGHEALVVTGSREERFIGSRLTDRLWCPACRRRN